MLGQYTLDNVAIVHNGRSSRPTRSSRHRSKRHDPHQERAQGQHRRRVPVEVGQLSTLIVCKWLILCTNKQTDGQTYRRTERQTGRETGRQTDRRANRQTTNSVSVRFSSARWLIKLLQMCKIYKFLFVHHVQLLFLL